MSAESFWNSTDWHLQNTNKNGNNKRLIFLNKTFSFLGFSNNNISHDLLISMSNHILEFGGSILKWPECQKYEKTSSDVHYFITNYSLGFARKPVDACFSKFATPLWLYFSCIDGKIYPTDYIPFFRPSKYFKPLDFKKYEFKICLIGFTGLKRIRNTETKGRSKLDMQIHLHFLKHSGMQYLSLKDVSNSDYILCGRPETASNLFSQGALGSKPVISVDWIYALYTSPRKAGADSFRLNLSISAGVSQTHQLLADYSVYISHMAIIANKDLVDICSQLGGADPIVINPISLFTEEARIADKEILLICHPNSEYPNFDYDASIHASYGLVNYLSTIPEDEFIASNISLLTPQALYEAKRQGALDMAKLLQVDNFIESIRIERRCEADSSEITINEVVDSVSYGFQDIFFETNSKFIGDHSFLKIVSDYRELSTEAEALYSSKR